MLIGHRTGQALVESTSPRRGEKVLGTGEVAVMELEGNRITTTAPRPDAGAATSTAFLRQLRDQTPNR